MELTKYCSQVGRIKWTPWSPDGPPGVHLEAIWSPGGVQVDFGYNLAGPPAKESPCGLHVDFATPRGLLWSLGGFYGGG